MLKLLLWKLQITPRPEWKLENHLFALLVSWASIDWIVSPHPSSYNLTLGLWDISCRKDQDETKTKMEPRLTGDCWEKKDMLGLEKAWGLFVHSLTFSQKKLPWEWAEVTAGMWFKERCHLIPTDCRRTGLQRARPRQQRETTGIATHLQRTPQNEDGLFEFRLPSTYRTGLFAGWVIKTSYRIHTLS